MMLEHYNKMPITNVDTPSVKNKFTLKDDMLFKLIWDVDKWFEGLATSHNLQEQAGTNKTYS